jgi:hypothetical protein
MELLHLIRFLLRLDERALLALEKWVPDLDRVLNNPQEALDGRDIEIGPWNRYVERYVLPVLLIIPTLTIIFLADTLAVTVGATLAWLLLAGALVSTSRGGSCLLQSEGVEFRHRDATVFCPWDLFHVGGQPIYHLEEHRLDLPVQPAAIGSIQVWKNDRLIGEGLEASARHVEVLPSVGEIHLKLKYGVKPEELGCFLLELGRKLGTPLEQVTPQAPAPSFLPVQSDQGGWIQVSVTRLRFPPFCCDCGQATDRGQKFRGHPSFFSTSTNSFVDVIAPVCGNCQRLNHAHYWRTFFKTVFLVVLAMTALGFLLGVVLDLCGVTPGPGAMTVIMTCCGLIASLGLSWFFATLRARAVWAPLYLSDYRPNHGTIRLRFRSGQYAELFLAERNH